jgi:hypothetical protein
MRLDLSPAVNLSGSRRGGGETYNTILYINSKKNHTRNCSLQYIFRLFFTLKNCLDIIQNWTSPRKYEPICIWEPRVLCGRENFQLRSVEDTQGILGFTLTMAVGDNMWLSERNSLSLPRSVGSLYVSVEKKMTRNVSTWKGYFIY